MDASDAARRLRTTLDLFEVGERMQRARLQRLRPDADAETIETEMRRWLRSRPGAEHGDASGSPSRRF